MNLISAAAVADDKNRSFAASLGFGNHFGVGGGIHNGGEIIV